VPFEGQALRSRTGLRPRDKGFLAALAAAAVVASGAEAYLHLGRHHRAASCVTITEASTMGGSTIHRCGAAAVRFCREAGPTDPRVAAACRRIGS
jgi:hypothetical protein